MWCEGYGLKYVVYLKKLEGGPLPPYANEWLHPCIRVILESEMFNQSQINMSHH